MKDQALRVLMLGPPGSGKGTHGARIAAEFGVAHISTGELLRRQVADRTPIGLVAASAMAYGDLVADDIIIDLVLSEITSSEGYVLDGFPRTLVQAEAAYRAAREHRVELQAVIVLEVDRAQLRERILVRGAQTGRADDTEETFTHRLNVYDEQTSPLLAFYGRRRLTVYVDGSGSIEEVGGRISDVLHTLGD